LVKILSNTFRVRRSVFGTGGKYSARYSLDKLKGENKKDLLPVNTKILCWTIFLIFFIENGTLGLLPRQAYFIYRNVRLSDILIYGLVIYSLFNVKQFNELYRSKALLIVKILFLYFLFEFLVSSFLYEFNIVEYFFRLKGLWSSFIIFPFLLLVKRNGLAYLIRIIFPVAIVSNILYILSALTGIAFLPDIGIAKQYLEGGLKVYRVFGGTFYGEFFFLGYIYYWITDRFRLYQLFLVIFFIVPHILAFGRAAWIYFLFTIILMLGWNALKKRGFRILFRQAILISVLAIALIYSFIRFVPGSDYLTEALGKRVIQGQEDVTYEKGTYGSRLTQNETLLELWMNSNILMGIGMHPMWVYRPETTEEVRYYSGFSDVRWTAVLAAYGLIGFSLAIILQLYYIVITFKLLKRTQVSDILTFFLLLMMSQLLFDSLISYNYALISINQFGLTFHFALFTAVVVYKYHQLFE
jgi:hypothetical protein